MVESQEENKKAQFISKALAEFKYRWAMYSLAQQLLLFTLVFSTILFLIIRAFFEKKSAYDNLPLFAESQLKKSAEIEARLRGFLKNEKGALLTEIDEFSEKYQGMLLPRLPIDEEVFVGDVGYPVVIGRKDDSYLWLKPLSGLPSFWKIEDGFAYLITSGGVNLGSSKPDVLTPKAGMKRKEIDEFFRTGTAQGAKIQIVDGFGESVVIHREIKSTNVVLFTIAPIEETSKNHGGGFIPQIGLYVAGLSIVLSSAFYLFSIITGSLRSLVIESSNTETNLEIDGSSNQFIEEFVKLKFVIALVKSNIGKVKVHLREESSIRRLLRQLISQRQKHLATVNRAFAIAEFLVKYPREKVRYSSSCIYLMKYDFDSNKIDQVVKIVLTVDGRLSDNFSQVQADRNEIDSLLLLSKTRNDQHKSNRFHDVFVTEVEKTEKNSVMIVFKAKGIAYISDSDKKWLGILAKISAKYFSESDLTP